MNNEFALRQVLKLVGISEKSRGSERLQAPTFRTRPKIFSRGYKLATELSRQCDSIGWGEFACLAQPTATADATAEFQSRGLVLNKFLT